MRAIAMLLAIGCAGPSGPEAWGDWYEEGTPYDVLEPVAFTDTPYAFPEVGPGIADLPIPADFETAFAPEDAPPRGCADWVTDPGLPMEFEGLVTIHPRFYFKAPGCLPPRDDDPDADSDEKFYGSYFIEDATGGVFVLGDSKVAHFDMGDRVRIRVRAVRNRFDLVAVAVHDIVEVIRGPEPIHYEETVEAFGSDDVARVKRVTGTVVTDPDTFGEFLVEGDDGTRWAVSLDVELNRRGIRYPMGTRLQATGPIMYSFSAYSMVIMRVGQISVLE